MQPERMREWLDAGAAGVAVGNILAYHTTDSAAAEQQRELAKQYLELIN